MEHAYHQAADPFPPSQTPMALSPSHQPLEPWRHHSTLAMQMSGQLFSVLPMLPRPHFRHLTVSKSAAPRPPQSSEKVQQVHSRVERQRPQLPVLIFPPDASQLTGRVLGDLEVEAREQSTLEQPTVSHIIQALPLFLPPAFLPSMKPTFFSVSVPPLLPQNFQSTLTLRVWVCTWQATPTPLPISLESQPPPHRPQARRLLLIQMAKSVSVRQVRTLSLWFMVTPPPLLLLPLQQQQLLHLPED